MNIRKVKQGARITYYNGIYMILLGVFYFVFLNYIMKTNFNSISKLWGFFSRYNADISSLFVLFCILIGILLITNGITLIYLSDFIIKRKEKMTWVILFIIGILSWGGLLTINILFKNWTLIITSLIGWVSFIIGMLIPIRYYLEKSYREY